MNIEDNAGTEVSGEDTAAVLSHAADGEKTYLPEREEADTGQDDPSGDDAAAETEAQAEPPPKKASVQDRIDELTRDKHAERRAREALERELAELRAQQAPKTATPSEDAEPDPADFTYGEADPAYIRELGKHTARQEFKRLTREQEQRAQVRTVEQTWEQRQADFAKEHPDFHEKLDNPDLTITPIMADAIKTSDEGAKVAYHLAQNPDEARRIAALNPLAQVRELGRLEAKLATPPAEPTPQPKTVSDAPPPHPQARGVTGQFKPAADTNDFAAFESAYVNRRG